MKPRLREALVPGLFALFGVVYVSSVHALPRESTVFPYAVLGALVVLTVLVLLREADGPVARGPASDGPGSDGPRSDGQGSGGPESDSPGADGSGAEGTGAEGTGPDSTARGWRADLGKPLIVLAGSLGYLVLFHYAGFVVAGCVFMVATMLALRVRVWTALLVALPFVGGMYLLFSKLFYVDL